MSQYTWDQTLLPHLGHIDPEKIQAVADWLQSSNLIEVQEFLAVTNFLYTCIQGYTNFAMPLSLLLRKNLVHQRAVCNASGFDLGAVLGQQGMHIAVWSRKVVPAEQTCHITRHRSHAALEALKAFG